MPNESDGTKGRGIFQRIDHLLFKPHQEIKGSRMRQQAQYLSILLLVAVPVFAFAQLVSDLTINLTYLAISMSYLACYFLSRTRFYHITSGITVIASSLLPIALFVLGSDWVPYDLPRILVWVTLSILMGALFIRPRYVILQFTIISLVLLYFSLLHFAMPWYDIAEFFATEFLIAVLIIISAVMVHNYADRTQVQTADLEKRRWELEVYSQLLRHDIRNDLQMLLGSVELAEMLCNINSGDTQRQLSTSLKIGQSIVSLLNAFSVFPEDVGLSFVRFLEKLSLQAKEGYENLEITIKSTARARQ
ncbi:MAG: hypothetical protein KAQ65_06680, partial [Candidatus Thorarchaeota archaeon]|nr:hypothetical protein [Candidatus Thorarchaeota archaeon]